MKLASDYITSVLKTLNPRLSEIDDYDYLDNPSCDAREKFDIDFGEYDIVKKDQFFDINAPFNLRVFYSYENQTKKLNFHIIEQAKKIIRKLTSIASFHELEITNVEVNNFSIVKSETNNKILTLSINGQISLIESL